MLGISLPEPPAITALDPDNMTMDELLDCDYYHYARELTPNEASSLGVNRLLKDLADADTLYERAVAIKDILLSCQHLAGY